jgi:hypothetical protein
MGTLNTFALTIRNALTVAVLIFGASLGFAGTAHAHGTHVAPAPTPQVRHHHQGPFSVLHQGPFMTTNNPATGTWRPATGSS